MSSPDKMRIFDAIEADLCDAACMAGIASDQIARVFSELDIHRQLAGGRDDFYYIPESQRDQIIFAVNHVEGMVADMKARFNAALDDCNADVDRSGHSA